MADIAELFKPELVFFDIEATGKEDFFKQLGDKLDEQGYIQDTWYDAIVTREKNFPMGLQAPEMGVAIPHTDPEHLKKAYMAVVVPKTPVPFVHMGTMDEMVDAEFIVNLGVEHQENQVEALQKLMGMFVNSDAVAELKAQTTGEGMVEVIRKYLA